MTTMRITHIGGPTALIEVGGWRILTDPTFDAPGRRYNFGWGTSSRKLAGPAVQAADLGQIDAVLLSHDHHEDNLDPAGRALLPNAGTILTTQPGAKRLSAKGATNAQGLAPWQSTTLEAPGKTPIEITATPCRHGPPLSRPIVGAVIGFALKWDGQQHGVVWISGDTVLYEGVREVPERLSVGTAILHLGGVRFPVSGPLRYTMTAKEAVELARLTEPHTAVPIHYEGWKHFREGRDAVERELTGAPLEMRERFRWIPIGEPVELEV
jgi:L-ascorbate metabolism protein UlaG (beta-lactamase superfamily)